MKRSELKLLKDRWCDEEITSKPLNIESSPFGRTDAGMIDFRGANLSNSIHAVTVSDVDLSYSNFNRQMSACNFRNFRFKGCKYECNLGDYFVGCDFTDSNLNGSMLSGEFHDCIFTNVNFRRVKTAKTKYVNCVFTNANFSSSAFYECFFENCNFEGSIFNSTSSVADSVFVDCKVNIGLFKGAVIEGIKIK